MTNPTTSGDPMADSEDLKSVLAVPGMHLVDLGTAAEPQPTLYHECVPPRVFHVRWPPEDPEALVAALRAAADEVLLRTQRQAGGAIHPETEGFRFVGDGKGLPPGIKTDELAR